MLIKCLEGQIPFIVTYILYILFFVNLYATLEVQIDPELDLDDDNHAGMRYMGYYGMLVLTTYRNSVGKLGYVRYENLIALNKPDLKSHINSIWVVYFIQIMFTLIIGLNFMIAILEAIYKKEN